MNTQCKPVIVFLCVENSCRSQIAEAFGKMVDQDAYEIKSAGSSPFGKVDSRAINVMSELGYDLSSHSSTSVNELAGEEIALVVSMGCGDACPNLSAKKRIDWEVADPKRMSLEDFRRIRDLIKVKVETLFVDIDREMK